MSIGNDWENYWLNHILNAGTLTQVATAYVSLHTADPGETGTAELSGGTYARQVGSFGAASGGSAQNDAAIQFDDLPASTINYGGIWADGTATDSTAFIYGGALDSPGTITAGQSYQIPSGSLNVTLD